MTGAGNDAQLLLFEMGVSLIFCLGCLDTVILLIYVSADAGITSTSEILNFTDPAKP
jgi:hypothetical protein